MWLFAPNAAANLSRLLCCSLRARSKASCKVAPQCFAAVMDGPWGGHASAAGTARFATGAAAAEGHFREHTIRYTGEPKGWDHAPGLVL